MHGPLKHKATPKFWERYRVLPEEVQRLADRKFEILKSDPYHPSLHFKKIGHLWSCRVGLHYRTLGTEVPDGIAWFWIGPHGEYDSLLK